MQLKEKTSACILWATNLHSAVQCPYSLWSNSAVLKHKKGNLIGNIKNIIGRFVILQILLKKQTCILWADTVLRVKFGMLSHKTCIPIRNVLVKIFNIQVITLIENNHS